MSLRVIRVLKLDPLYLTDSEHHLKLSVVSSVELRIPGSLSSLAHDTLVQFLTTRKLWVTRGVACHLDIQVLFNGKPLDQNGRLNLLESLGYRIRDAPLWSQLSLSASLDVWQISVDPSPDISIAINHDIEPTIPQAPTRAWTLENFDIKPPESVLCAELQRVEIQFKFTDIQKKQPPSKRAKSGPTKYDDQEVMLLDLPQGFNAIENMTELAHAVEGMKGLSGMIEGCFESKAESSEDPDLLQFSWSTLDWLRPPVTGQYPVENFHRNNKTTNSNRLPAAAIEIMNVWLLLHPHDPYPSNEEKLEMARKSGLERAQISRWFERKRSEQERSRRRKNSSVPNPKMLLEQVNETPTHEQYDDHEVDALLLSQSTDATPSLTSQYSAISSIFSISHIDSSQKRPLPDSEPFHPHKGAACDLGIAVLHILISGHIVRGLPFIVEKPPPSLSLMNISPDTFCPGFKKSMAHNARFLPTVSSAISLYWPRNVQSPSLRRKLAQLATLAPSTLTDEIGHTDGEIGTIGRLAAVVQSRSWGMMQRKLYDLSEAAKLWRKFASKAGETDEDESPDLFGIVGEKEETTCRVTELGDFSDEEMEEFEDLLSGDEDDLLEYMEERERLSVERETDDMLFGSEWDEEQEEQEDECLLSGELGSDDMLL